MSKRIIVIGGRPGGYIATFESAKNGVSVTLIEKINNEKAGLLKN